MMFDELSFPALWTAIGSAVLQFLWQGAVIGVVTALLLAALRGRPASERCNVAYGGLLVSLGVFATSLFWESSRATALPAARLGTIGAHEGAPLGSAASAWETNALIAGLWAFGVLIMGARFALQNRAVQRLKTHDVEAAEPRWQRLFAQLREELGVDRGVRLLSSTLAEVPMVVGWVSPVVLVPASAFTGMSCDQLRSLLAHELAHIARKDHLLNAVQAVIEALLFFHPAVWWISKQVRLEREYCCDDSSVQVLGDPKLLAEALATMEALRLTPAALGANGGPLMQRITRILGVRRTPRTALSIWQIPAGLVVAGALALGGNAYTHATGNVQSSSQEELREKARAQEVQEKKDRHEQELKLRKRDLAQEAENVKARIDAAVKSGRITKAQGAERFAAWKQELAERQEVETQFKAVRAEIVELLKSGKITEAEAEKKLVAFERKIQERRIEAEAKRVWDELQKQVDAGTLTAPQAKERYAEFMQKFKLERKRRSPRNADPEAFLRNIEEQVEAGKLTPAEGKKQIEAYRERRAQQTELKREIEEMERRVKTAIESGEMSAEDGKRRLEHFRRKLEEREQKARLERVHAASIEEIQKKLQAEVESGRLTSEEARDKLEQVKQQMKEVGDAKERKPRQKKATKQKPKSDEK